MLHKIHSNEAPSISTVPFSRRNGIHLAGRSGAPIASASRIYDLILIISRRCSSFFAEAAVLVLVFGILDYFMLKGRIELPWILGALAISVGLLAASIAMDFAAQTWARACP